jgi:hypothetical protein
LEPLRLNNGCAPAHVGNSQRFVRGFTDKNFLVIIAVGGSFTAKGLLLLEEESFAGFEVGQTLRQHGNRRPQLRHIGAFGKPVLDALLVLKDLQLPIFNLRVHFGNLSSGAQVG